MQTTKTQSIYKNYDIRGKFGDELTVEEVSKIGKAVVELYKPKTVAIGRDIRPSADILFETLANSITEMGADVVDLGLCTTPMSYFACGRADIDVSIMITASHMPAEYNGLKIAIQDAKPATKIEMEQIHSMVLDNTFTHATIKGKVTPLKIQSDWIQFFKSKFDFSQSNFSIVVDPANMIGGLEIETFRSFSPDITVHSIFADFDSSCPNHEANPLLHETLESLSKEVVEKGASIGVAFDGDADRVGLVDENGRSVPSDIIGAIIAEKLLEQNPGAKVICDVRASDALIEEIERLGGIPIREKVGHINIRTSMRTHDAVLGIELSCHTFFKETNFSEGGPLPAFIVLEQMAKKKQTLSQLVSKIEKYYQSGEINSTVTRRTDIIINDLKEKFSAAKFDSLDGLTIREQDWWCNVRNSATEPVMRLNVEAKDQQKMEEMRDILLNIIRS